MTVGVLLMTHESVGQALVKAARHVLPKLPLRVATVEVPARADPDVINGSRRKRIAAGAGVDVSEVNKLLKMHRQMADMMKKMGKGKMPMMPPGMGGGFPGGMPPGLFPGRR